MDFLGNLCVCECRAIPSTQSKNVIVSGVPHTINSQLFCYEFSPADTVLNKLVYEYGKVQE